MSELTFVQGDTAPDITAVLHDVDDVDAPLDLTGATVKFQMRKPDDKRFTIDAAADVLDELAGEVGYTWSTNDLAVPGDYETQWEVTFADLRKQTNPTPNLITVRRK